MAFVAVLTALALSAGCGSGGDGATSGDSASSAHLSAPPRPDRCRVGASALAAIPGAPSWWQEGERPPIVLACLRGDGSGGAALVGFALGEGSCVVPYVFGEREAADERCTEPGTSWTIQCEGRLGCTSAFVHEPGRTQLDGPVEARVEGVEVMVEGKRLERGVMFASVRGRTARAIGAREPFGFFFVSIPRCIAPSAFRVELLGADGSHLGRAQGWDVVVPPCGKPPGEATPSA
jgi:hypothetical protein